MGADQVAAIRPAIAELEAAEASATPGAAAQYFARFSLAGHECPWVEAYLEQKAVLNLWYPFDAGPLDYLRQLGIGIHLFTLDSEGGYAVRINNGADAGQEIFHLHLHVLGGRKMGMP